MDFRVILNAMSENEKKDIFSHLFNYYYEKNINLFIDSITYDEKKQLFVCLFELFFKNDFYILKNNDKTPIEEWINKNESISSRLRNVLMGNFTDTPPYPFVEEITKNRFLKLYMAGDKLWNEFVKLRGY